MLAVALTAARASAVRGLACFWALPWVRAMPFMILRTPSWSVGSSWPWFLWAAARAALCSRMVATDSPRSSARWAR